MSLYSSRDLFLDDDAREQSYQFSVQQETLNAIAAKLGVVAYRPDYFGKGGDKNTVLFYTKEAAAHNREVDRQPTRYSPGDAQDLPYEVDSKYVYRPYFWVFENTDVNGRLSTNYGNRGKIQLYGAGWKERLEGHIRLAYLRHCQYSYVGATGGWLALREAEDTYNDLNREIIAAARQAHGEAFIGYVNAPNREEIANGTADVYEEFTGQKVYNFGGDFVVPVRDKELEELLRKWSQNDRIPGWNDAEAITNRISEIGGENLLWT